MDDTARARLQEVIAKGPPGQAAHAERLLLQVNGAAGRLPADLADEVDVLFDAYLNDPYLTRTDAPRR